jgi:hypothetical protein
LQLVLAAVILGIKWYWLQGDEHIIDYQDNVCPLVAYNKPFSVIKSFGVIRMQS